MKKSFSISLILYKSIGLFIVLTLTYLKASAGNPIKNPLTRFEYQITDSFKIKNNHQEAINSHIHFFKGYLLYYSRDSNQLAIYNTKTDKTEYLKFQVDFLQKDPNYKPFILNFGNLNDSTIVVAFESRWPYFEDKIFLLNLNSHKITFPFKSPGSNFISKYDTSVHSFKEAYDKRKTWFAVSYYQLPVRAKDTTVFTPVYTGKITNDAEGELRSNANCIFPISTIWNPDKPEEINISFSQVNPVFKDSINSAEGIYEFTNCSVMPFNNQSCFLATFNGSKNAVKYDWIKKQTDIIQVEFPENEFSDITLNASSIDPDNTMYYTNFSQGNGLMLRSAFFPNLSNINKSGSFIHFVYDKSFELKGVINPLPP